MSKITNKFSPEVRQRAIRMMLDHEPSILRGGCRFIYCGQDRLLASYAARMGQEDFLSQSEKTACRSRRAVLRHAGGASHGRIA